MKRTALKQKKKDAEEREQPTCPICRCEFYATESPEQVDAHLTSCSRKAAAAEAEAAAATAVATAESTGTNVVAGSMELNRSSNTDIDGVNIGNANMNNLSNVNSVGMNAGTATATNKVIAAATAAATGAPMPMVLSNALVIGLRGGGLESLVAAVEELVSSGMRPTEALCDRAMQQLIKSRCVQSEPRTQNHKKGKGGEWEVGSRGVARHTQFVFFVICASSSYSLFSICFNVFAVFVFR